jgi:hypothetical protein
MALMGSVLVFSEKVALFIFMTILRNQCDQIGQFSHIGRLFSLGSCF